MTYAEPGVIIGVAGNKVDKPKASGFELKRLCEACADWDASLHFTSALTGEGVDDLFLTVAKRSAAHVAAQRKNIDSVRVATAESPNLPCC